MTTNEQILTVIEIPKEEKVIFEAKIKSYREKYIRKSDILVNEVFEKYPELTINLKNNKASLTVTMARELVWKQFLIEESNFNAILLKDLSIMLNTPRKILEQLIKRHIIDQDGDSLKKAIMEICGEYSGRVSPYIYALSLSNTQSRRSRSGSTFQSVMYKIYQLLNYPYSSQKKVGTKIFTTIGLGKIVDSVLPGVEEFTQRRSKTIIGTMKTSLRERWQEVIEEIERTNIPQIYLLTVDPDISLNKAKQMNEHNVTLVVPNNTLKENLKEMRNIITFETYLFEEIPLILEYWKK